MSAVRQVTRSAATTPGRLSVIAVGLVILTLLAGLVGALALQEKRSTINDLIDHREPLAAAAQQLYRSLSDADATAASAFLSGGLEPAALRERYEIDISQAGAAMAKASSDVGGIPEAEVQVQQLAQQLPIYTALVETARANNRQGFPAGAAYLREASGLMRAKILPAAHELYTIDFDRLAAEQHQARAFPWFAAVLAVLLLAALVATQVYLTRKTNRLINIGLLAATVSLVLGLGWGAVALLIESGRVADGHRNGSQQVELLVQARIVTLKCRADETLTLVARGDGPEYEEEFAKLSPAVTGDTETNLLVQAKNRAADQAMASEVQAAVDNTTAWLAAHAKVRELDDGGQYEDAVKLAIGDAPGSSATSFARLDENLDTALTAGRQEFLNRTLGARAALTGLVPGIAVLSLIAVAGIIIGIAERLREYR
jgi:CHASE3 domain sensor protein